MDEMKNQKSSVLAQVAERLNALSPEALEEKYRIIEDKLFEFANFMEAQQAFIKMRLEEMDRENTFRLKN